MQGVASPLQHGQSAVYPMAPAAELCETVCRISKQGALSRSTVQGQAKIGCWQVPGLGLHLLCLLTTLSKPSAARRSREARRPYSRGMMGV